ILSCIVVRYLPRGRGPGHSQVFFISADGLEKQKGTQFVSWGRSIFWGGRGDKEALRPEFLDGILLPRLASRKVFCAHRKAASSATLAGRFARFTQSVGRGKCQSLSRSAHAGRRFAALEAVRRSGPGPILHWATIPVRSARST